MWYLYIVIGVILGGISVASIIKLQSLTSTQTIEALGLGLLILATGVGAVVFICGGLGSLFPT